MKILTYISPRYSCFIFAVVLAATVLGCSCSTSNVASDPLAGWHNLGFVSENVPKAIQDDYQTYIRQNIMAGHAGPIQFFEDGTGRHAIEFEAFEHNKNASWHYALIYNKENERVNVIKYHYAEYQS